MARCPKVKKLHPLVFAKRLESFTVALMPLMAHSGNPACRHHKNPSYYLDTPVPSVFSFGIHLHSSLLTCCEVPGSPLRKSSRLISSSSDFSLVIGCHYGERERCRG